MVFIFALSTLVFAGWLGLGRCTRAALVGAPAARQKTDRTPLPVLLCTYILHSVLYVCTYAHRSADMWLLHRLRFKLRPWPMGNGSPVTLGPGSDTDRAVRSWEGRRRQHDKYCRCHACIQIQTRTTDTAIQLYRYRRRQYIWQPIGTCYLQPAAAEQSGWWASLQFEW
jgi:hypothetical protein